MQLVSISLSGFKSFPKGTKLTFSEGVTAVVGPNGCGKTNIVDAVRWALGEQKTSVLRSDRMDNVIFNGTATRKPVGMAEVCLVIDNSDGALPTPYSNVEIKRRLYRDGGSEYYLNGIASRLKDVVDLIQDTGLGPDSYSILELRMVEDILREGGEGRRHLFEEVAGVAKYKTRRHQSQNKLHQTEEDLLRLADILSEVERQVSSLKRQMSRARRYQKLQTSLSTLELGLEWQRFVKLQAELKPMEQAMKQTSDSVLAARNLLRAEEATLEEQRMQALMKEKEFTKSRANLEVCITDVAALETENATLDARKAAARDIISHAERARILLREKKELLAKKQEFQEGETRKYSKAFEAAEAKHTEVKEAYHKLEKVLEEVLYRTRHHDKYLADLRADVAAKGRQLAEKKAALSGFEGRRDAYEQEREQILGQKKELELEQSRIAEQEAEMEKPLHELKREETEFQQKLQTCEEDKQQLEGKLRESQRILDLTESKLELLKTLSEKGPRSDPALKFLQEKPVAGLIDLLSDAVEVQEPYSRAFAAILGPAAYYYLVESMETAFSAVSALKDANAGRAVFIPVSELKSEQVSQSPLPEGTVGRAIDFVNGKLSEPVASHFLGKVVIVQDWEAACALKQWGRENELTLVTLQGEWITPQGAVCGGAATTKTPADFGLKKQHAQLEEELQQARTNLEAVNEEKETCAQQRAAILEELTQTQKRVQSVESEYNRLREKRQQKSMLLEHHQTRLTIVEKELTELAEKIQTARVEEQDDSAALDGAQEKLDKGSLSSTDLERELSEARQEATASKEQLHRSERKCDAAKHQLELAQIELQRMIATAEEITAEIQSSEKRAVDAEKEESVLSNRKKEIEGQLLEKFRSRDEAALDVDRRNTELDEARENVRLKEEKLRSLRSEREDELDGERRLEREIARLQAEREALLAGVRTKHGLDLSDEIFAEEHPDVIEAETNEELVAELRNKIEHLGPVNLLAIEEYEQENERLQSMQANRDDLLKAKATLEETIAKINETAQEKFLETFRKVRANFQVLFREFFGSGEADLILSGTDLLEADVTLWANPSGKRLKSLSLMSGGEKAMTAIALLFALYQVKPSPFCILDEVDAPLDDSNIVRFNEMIKKHAPETQFILITHNKRTMEAAETLWGVTMEEEGISKVVSVRFVT